MKDICIVGAGGHAHSILSLIKRCGSYNPIGFIDSCHPVGSYVHSLPILGGIEDIANVRISHSFEALVIAIGDNYRRMSLAQHLETLLEDIDFPPLVDPTATLSSNVTISSGVVVMAQAYVGPGCVLENGVLLNTKASLDHDSIMNLFSSLAPGVTVGGHVRIGRRSSLGLGSSVIHRVSIGADAVVGAGSLVLSDVPSAVLAYGSPIRVIRHRQADEPYL
jgi:sugar O-acyltransferase (sialic acid O-acetyltransferase NeuD family)